MANPSTLRLFVRHSKERNMRLLDVTAGRRFWRHPVGGAVLAAALFGTLVGTGQPANAAPAAPTKAAPAAVPAAAVPAAAMASLERAAAASSSLPVDDHYVGLTNKDGRPELFWRGSDCQLWHNWVQTNGTISNSYPLGGCLLHFLLSPHDIAGFLNGDRLEIMAIGTNNELFHVWQLSAGGAWSTWNGLGGTLVGPPWVGLLSNGAFYVDAIGPDNIWHRRYQDFTTGWWSPWVFGAAH
ncbi:MAG: hypothetical protein V7637_4093 [Mycobacteriales bacterium]|jgi:hypothetical protein